MALLWLVDPVVRIHLQQRTKPIELLLIHRLALGPAPSAWLAQPALRKVFGAELDFHPKHALANGVNITRHLRRIKARKLVLLVPILHVEQYRAPLDLIDIPGLGIPRCRNPHLVRNFLIRVAGRLQHNPCVALELRLKAHGLLVRFKLQAVS